MNNEYQIKDEYDFIIFTKMINLITVVNGKTLDQHTYVLKQSINMINIKAYQTPKKEFKGILKGADNPVDFNINDPITINNNFYIYNLNIAVPYVTGSNYYLGLFSLLSGTVTNINFYKNTVAVPTSNDHFGKTIYVGMVAAKMTGDAKVKNIISASNIHLGTEAIGTVYAGGIVGQGRGTLLNVANIVAGGYGVVNGGIHSFSNQNIIPNFYVGGIIGANDGVITIKK